MQKTAIIIPCYNEEKRLNTQAFFDFATSNANIHFIMVNDGSSDNTDQILSKLANSHEQITSLALAENSGKAEAVRTGFNKAFSLKYNLIGYWDADLATPLCEIYNLLSCFRDSRITMVFGSRIRLLGRQISRKPSRHYLGRFFATIVSLILRITVYDTQCGAKIFKNTPDLQSVFSEPFKVRWIFDVEMIARFIRLNKHSSVKSFSQSAVELPLQTWQDVPGSKLTHGDILKAIMELAQITYYLYHPGKNASKI